MVHLLDKFEKIHFYITNESKMLTIKLKEEEITNEEFLVRMEILLKKIKVMLEE